MSSRASIMRVATGQAHFVGRVNARSRPLRHKVGSEKIKEVGILCDASSNVWVTWNFTAESSSCGDHKAGELELRARHCSLIELWNRRRHSADRAFIRLLNVVIRTWRYDTLV
ncbi:hypothetical protein BgiMline_004643 [Biomphalaria glabrata]|nr:hypothetical protein BgiMline_002743 [Biomphalaria glabrata]